jgi:hypothetical protein
MSINVITGLPGSGKTLYLARTMQQYLKEGRKVASNFKVNDSRVRYSLDIFQLLGGESEVIFLDELQLFLNSRNWDNLPMSIQYRLQQHRKFGLDIWGSVQNIKRLDVVARELIQRYFEIVKILGSVDKGKVLAKHPFGLFLVREFVPDDAELKRRSALNMSFFLLNRKDYSFYDTLQPIGVDAVDIKNTIVQIPAYICPTCHHRRLLK